jgi:hypothetical protein
MNRATATILSDELLQNGAGDAFPTLIPLVPYSQPAQPETLPRCRGIDSVLDSAWRRFRSFYFNLPVSQSSSAVQSRLISTH